MNDDREKIARSATRQMPAGAAATLSNASSVDSKPMEGRNDGAGRVTTDTVQATPVERQASDRQRVDLIGASGNPEPADHEPLRAERRGHDRRRARRSLFELRARRDGIVTDRRQANRVPAWMPRWLVPSAGRGQGKA